MCTCILNTHTHTEWVLAWLGLTPGACTSSCMTVRHHDRSMMLQHQINLPTESSSDLLSHTKPRARPQAGPQHTALIFLPTTLLSTTLKGPCTCFIYCSAPTHHNRGIAHTGRHSLTDTVLTFQLSYLTLRAPCTSWITHGGRPCQWHESACHTSSIHSQR